MKGFVHPARVNEQKPLWYFDIPNRVWTERSTREIGYRHDLYDYEICI